MYLCTETRSCASNMDAWLPVCRSFAHAVLRIYESVDACTGPRASCVGTLACDSSRLTHHAADPHVVDQTAKKSSLGKEYGIPRVP